MFCRLGCTPSLEALSSGEWKKHFSSALPLAGSGTVRITGSLQPEGLGKGSGEERKQAVRRGCLCIRRGRTNVHLSTLVSIVGFFHSLKAAERKHFKLRSSQVHSLISCFSEIDSQEWLRIPETPLLCMGNGTISPSAGQILA